MSAANAVDISVLLDLLSQADRDLKRAILMAESYSKAGTNIKLLPSYQEVKIASFFLSEKVAQIRSDLNSTRKSD